MINEKRLLDTFVSLVSLDSPSRHERPVSDYIKNYLSSLGIDVAEDKNNLAYGGDCGNLHAYIDGVGESLLFCCHMDTVEPSCGKVAVIHPDGMITSGGDTVLGADDFAGVSSLLEGLYCVLESGVSHRPIELLFTAAEEAYCLGSSNISGEQIKSRRGYVLDLTGRVGSISNIAPAILSFEVTVTGRAAHAGFSPENGISAITAAAKAIVKLKQGRLPDGTTFNVGRIEGGGATNIVPDTCRVRCEVRSYDNDEAYRLMEDAVGIFKATACETGAVAVSSPLVLSPAYHTPKESEVINRFKAVCDKLGAPFKLVPTFGGSDQNSLSQIGVEGAVIACGMNDCHGVHEYTELSELILTANIVYELMAV